MTTTSHARANALIAVTVITGALVLSPVITLQGAQKSSPFSLRAGADPRSAALGDSLLAFPDSSEGMLVNPAGAASLYRPKISLSDITFPEGLKYRAGAFGYPTKNGSFGVGMTVFDYGDIAGIDGNGQPYDAPRSQASQFILNYALSLHESGPLMREYGGLGVNVKLLQSNLAGKSSSGFAFDLGGIYRFGNLSAGLACRNLGSVQDDNNASKTTASSIGLGLRYDISALGDLFAVADAARDMDTGDLSYSLGAGVSPVYPLTLRGAWKETPDPASSGMRGGISLDFKDFSLSYSFSPLRDLSGVHYLGIDVSLGSFSNSKAAYNHYLNHYFEMARARFSRRDYIGARQLLEEILSVYPDHEPSKVYLEKISVVLDDIEQQKVTEIQLWLRKANVALSRNNVFEARKYFNTVLKYDPENQEALEGQEKIDAVVAEMQAVKTQRENRQKIDRLWVDAMEYYSKGEFVFAKEKFSQLMELTPGNPEVAKYVTEIDNQLAKVNALQINDLFVKGMDFFNAGSFREAVKYFNAVVIASPERSDAQELVAYCQARIKEEDDRARADELAAKQGKIKNEVENAYNAALQLYDNGDYEEAIQAFTRSRDLAQRNDFPKFAENSRNYIASSRTALGEKHYRRGFDYVKKNMLESAAEEYRKVLEYNPDHASARVELDRLSDDLAQRFYEQGMRAFTSGEKEKAKELFRKSLSYKSDKIESLRALERVQ